MNDAIFIKRLEKLNRLASKWIGLGGDYKAKEDIAWEIIEQYLATKRSELENHLCWSDQKRVDYNSQEFEAIFNWVTVDPITDLAKKGIAHLEKNELDKVREIFDELANDKKLISKIKSKIRESRGKLDEHPINTLITAELQKKPDIALPILIKRLHALEGKGVITQWDDEDNAQDNYIYSRYPDGREAPKAKVTGLKERFYEVRNKK